MISDLHARGRREYEDEPDKRFLLNIERQKRTALIVIIILLFIIKLSALITLAYNRLIKAEKADPLVNSKQPLAIIKYELSLRDDQVEQMKDLRASLEAAIDEIYPKLERKRTALVTVLYWDDIDPVKELEVMEEASLIGDSIDGILYPYMAQSLKKGLSHKDTYALASEIKRVLEVYPGIPVILDIYVTKHSGSPDLPDPKWVEGLLDIAKENADGGALYCMPKNNKDGSFADFWGKSMDNPTAIFERVKTKYNSWLRSGWKRTNFNL